jgi:hypothetical protein
MGVSRVEFVGRFGLLRLFSISCFDLENQRVDVAGTEFRVEMRHTALSVGDDGTEIVNGRVRDFIGNERRAAEMPAFGSLAMALGTIFFVNGVRGERGGVRARVLREGECTR